MSSRLASEGIFLCPFILVLPLSLSPPRIHYLLRLEEQDGAVSEVKVDEMLCLCVSPLAYILWLTCTTRAGTTMRDKASKVTAYDTMPGRSLSVVKLST